jgi:NTE family protein
MTEETKIPKKVPKIVTEICLAGACNRGISYIGCFKKLEEIKALDLKKVVGVSIGSFIGACFMLGYSSEELLGMVIDKDMNEFKDFSISEPSSVLKGETYKSWVFEVLARKEDPNITLKQLYEKNKIEFTVTTTCIHSTNNNFTEGIVYLSHKHTPDMSLFDAVNCSMAFPFIFPPMEYKGCQFIDGGVLDNFPMDLLSTNALGLKVNFKPIDSSTSTKNPISYIGKIFELMSNRFKILKDEPHQNIVTVNCDDFDVIDFGMSIDDKITLFKRGYKAMNMYIGSNPGLFFIDQSETEPTEVVAPVVADIE